MIDTGKLSIKQRQTPQFENKFVLQLIYLVAQCSEITKTELFLEHIYHDFMHLCSLLLL